MDKHLKGWERAKEMRRWRHKKGGLKAKPHKHLKTALGEALEDWISEQRRSGLRPSSIDGRRTHISLFIKWCWDSHVTRPEWISRGLMEGWLVWLDEHRTQNGTLYADASKESMSVANALSLLLIRQRLGYASLDTISISTVVAITFLKTHSSRRK